jgi:hypothetical protein
VNDFQRAHWSLKILAVLIAGLVVAAGLYYNILTHGGQPGGL